MGKSELPYHGSVSGWVVTEVLAMADQPLVYVANQPYLAVAFGFWNNPLR